MLALFSLKKHRNQNYFVEFGFFFASFRKKQ